MTTARLRSVLTYVGLVGLPLAGLIAVLRAGASLEASPAIAGDWVLEPESASGCVSVERLHFEQSGRFLQLRAGSDESDARFEGERVRGVVRAGDGPCAGTSLALDATVEGDVLAGTLTSDSCAACPSAPFRARRGEE